MTQLNPWSASSSRLKAALTVQETVEVPPADKWCLPYLCSLHNQRSQSYFNADEEEQARLTDLIASLVVN